VGSLNGPVIMRTSRRRLSARLKQAIDAAPSANNF